MRAELFGEAGHLLLQDGSLQLRGMTAGFSTNAVAPDALRTASGKRTASERHLVVAIGRTW